MNAFSARLSRHTPAIFACALANLLLAELAATAGLTWPVEALFAPATLAAVHLVTLGWLTLLMFGALFQFVPVISNRPLPSQRVTPVMLVVFELGLAAMVAGFLGVPGFHGLLLPAGGGLVAAAIVLGSADLCGPLARAARASLPARFVLAALGFLLATLLLGLGFALALRIPAVAVYLAPLVARGLAAHLVAGIGGWFTLTAIGVSYKLLPMFMLAPEERGALGEAVFGASTAGFALVVISVALGALLPGSTGRFVEAAGWGLAGVGVALYLADVMRLYRTRRRRAIELHNRAAVGAFVALALLVPAVLAWRAGVEAAAPLTVVLALAGWLSGLALTQLYKIVAFLSWLTHYGQALGRGAVPRVQDLVDEDRARPRFALLFAGVAVATAGAALVSALTFRIGTGLCLVTTLALAAEYQRAWRLHYSRRLRPEQCDRESILSKPAGAPPATRVDGSQHRI